MKRILSVALLFAICFGAQAAVQTKEVSYRVGDTELKGYLAYDDAVQGKRPGVLVVHEWWGHNDYARKRAEMLAGLGYVAFALDMYGDDKQASHPDDARKFMMEVKKNMPVARQRFEAALGLLRSDEHTDAERVAAIGYCFGGGVVLDMARMGLDLDGVVSFHGTLGTGNPAKPGQVKAKVLVLNGAADPFIKPEQIWVFKEEMKRAGVDYEFINYPGAKHAFTNPDADKFGKEFSLPLMYNAEADEKSWAEMQAFFKEIF